jgi:hypothetical protein
MRRLADPVSTKRPGVHGALDGNEQVPGALYLVDHQSGCPGHHRLRLRLGLGTQVAVIQVEIGSVLQHREGGAEEGGLSGLAGPPSRTTTGAMRAACSTAAAAARGRMGAWEISSMPV